MKYNALMAFLLFFVVFFRLSLIIPFLYLAFIPAFFGIMYLVRNFMITMGNGLVSIDRKNLLLLSIFIIIFLFCLVFDLFQKSHSFQSYFTVRLFMLFLFSFVPAYYLVNRFIKGDLKLMERILVYSLWVQIVIFFGMYISPELKRLLYTFFGMSDSVNLWEQNAKVRGFGLSGEINFMTPFLMIYMSFFMMKRRYALITLICLTQIVNSNMAVIAAIIGIGCSRLNINIKIATVLILGVLVYSLGAVFFPRFYDEFVSGDGTRTLDILLQQHVFVVGNLDFFNIIFGLQQNISSSIPDIKQSSDMGWVILFNYGGLTFITLFLFLIFTIIIRLSRVLAKFDEYCEHIIVHTGQNYDYELNEVFFNDLGVRKPDYFLNAAGKNAAETIGQVIIKVDEVLEIEKPEAILVLGDTNSCISAIPAKRRKVPIFHMEAGNRCFDQRVPEETNRRIVDHTADINMTYSDIAREYLLAEGIPADRIIKTGSPMFEVLSYYMPQIDGSDVLSRLNLQSGEFFVVSAHREENVDSPKQLVKLANILNTVAEKYNLPVIVSTHPRTRNRIREQGIEFHSNINLLKPLGFHDYNHLQKNSRAVLSDSGTITEESSIMNFPAVNIREAHERPEGFEEASVMMVGLECERVLQALDILATQPRGEVRLLRQVSDYSMPNVSDKVVRIVHSYTDYVKRVVWKEY